MKTARDQLLAQLTPGDREAVLTAVADLGLPANDPLLRLLAGVAFLNQRHLQAMAEREQGFLTLIQGRLNDESAQAILTLTPLEVSDLTHELRSTRRLAMTLRGFFLLVLIALVALVALLLWFQQAGTLIPFGMA